MFRDNQIVGPFASDDLPSVCGFSPQSLVCVEERKGTDRGDWHWACAVPELSGALRKGSELALVGKAGSSAYYAGPLLEPTMADLVTLARLQEKVAQINGTAGQVQESLRQRESDIRGMLAELEEKSPQAPTLADKLAVVEKGLSAIEDLQAGLEKAAATEQRLEAAVSKRDQIFALLSEQLQSLQAVRAELLKAMPQEAASPPAAEAPPSPPPAEALAPAEPIAEPEPPALPAETPAPAVEPVPPPPAEALAPAEPIAAPEPPALPAETSAPAVEPVPVVELPPVEALAPTPEAEPVLVAEPPPRGKFEHRKLVLAAAALLAVAGAFGVRKGLVPRAVKNPAPVPEMPSPVPPPSPPPVQYSRGKAGPLEEIPAKPAKPRPRVDPVAVMNACESEIGLFCYTVRNKPSSAIRCLRRRQEDLRPDCLKRLNPGRDAAD